MATVLQQSATPGTSQAASITRYYASGSGAILFAAGIESNPQVIIRTPGTASKLYINVTLNDRGASTLIFRKNTADGNQVVAITAATTGKFEDAINTDAVASGDVINYQLTTGAGGTTFETNAISHLYASGANTSQRLVSVISVNIGDGDFFPVAGDKAGSAGVNNETKIYGAGGTFKNLSVFVSNNTRDGASDVTLRKNAADEIITTSIPASTSGIFEDLVNTVAVVSTDLVNWQSGRGGTTGAVKIETISVDFETTDNSFLLVSNGNATLGSTDTRFININGEASPISSSETLVQSEARTAFTLNFFKVFIGANGITSTSTINVRKNGANGNLTVSIPSLANGEFEDLANSDVVTALDLLSLQFIGGATGTNLTLRNSNLTATVAPTIGGAQLLPIMGIGR